MTKAQFEALSSHIGNKKVIVAIARKLLVVVWHVLTKESADRFANPTQVVYSMFAFAHKVQVKNLPKGQTALGFTRDQLDRLKIGQEVKKLPWGTKTFTLLESKLTAKSAARSDNGISIQKHAFEQAGSGDIVFI